MKRLALCLLVGWAAMGGVAQAKLPPRHVAIKVAHHLAMTRDMRSFHLTHLNARGCKPEQMRGSWRWRCMFHAYDSDNFLAGERSPFWLTWPVYVNEHRGRPHAWEYGGTVQLASG